MNNVNYGKADGVIGLGHHYEDEEMSFMHMLKQYNVTDSKLFSIKLENVTDIEEEDATGKLYIGKHEDFSSKNTVTCPLITDDEESDMFWTFQIDGISLKKSNNEAKSSKSIKVILETATNYLLLPYDYLRDIEKNLTDMNCDVYQENRRSYYEIRCSGGENVTLPDFRLNINGTILTIPGKYAFELSTYNYYSRIYFTRNEETYIIGSPFLFAYHTLFDSDNQKLHFYQNFEEEKDGKDKDGKDKDGKDKDKDGKGKDGKGNDGKEDEPGKKKGKSKSNLALIISCIIGGILLLVALGILIYCCFIKKKDKKDELENNAENTEPIVAGNDENNEDNEKKENNENNEDNKDNEINSDDNENNEDN